jgi:DNA-binding winged helix-turn-helix (wHTH) protein
MALFHVPVQLAAADPAEKQAFGDILAGGQAGALTLAGPDETPCVVLVCPSGDMADIDALPAVVLGARTGVPENAQMIAIPAALADILAALENAALSSSDPHAQRHHGGWTLDPGRLTLQPASGEAMSLTDTEARLLICLFDAQGGNVTRDALLRRVWGYRPGLDTHTVETHIYRLRQKIEADPATPSVLVTTGDGYCFMPANVKDNP